MWVVISPDYVSYNAQRQGYTPYTVLGRFKTEQEARDCAAHHYFFCGRCRVREVKS